MYNEACDIRHAHYFVFSGKLLDLQLESGFYVNATSAAVGRLAFQLVAS